MFLAQTIRRLKYTFCDVFKLVFIKPNCINEKITDLWSSSSSNVPVSKKDKLSEEITAEVTEETIIKVMPSDAIPESSGITIEQTDYR